MERYTFHVNRSRLENKLAPAVSFPLTSEKLDLSMNNPIFRKVRTTLRRKTQNSKMSFGKFMFHSISHPDFPEWKTPVAKNWTMAYILMRLNKTYKMSFQHTK